MALRPVPLTDCSLHVHSLSQPGYPLQLILGSRGNGPLEFDFTSFGGWMAFTPKGTLIVSECVAT